MFPQILAAVIRLGDKDGGIEIGSAPFIIAALPFIFLILVFVLVIWARVIKMRLEHKQILAAIEKGTPLSELKPLKKMGADWIINLTTGIAFLLIGAGLAIIVLSVCGFHLDDDAGAGLFFSLVFIAFGIAKVLRGILQQKAEKALSSNKMIDIDKSHLPT